MLDAYDIISSFKNSNVKVVGVNEGFAVSAASYILASCDKRYARSYSMAMIHNPAVGNQSIDTKDVKLKNFLTKSRDGILVIYQSIFRDKNRDEIINLLNSETNFNADEQLAIGLVEEILDDDFKLVNELLELQVVNSLFGASREVRVFLIVFKNQPRDAGYIQERYWEGGNMNEIVVCVGIDENENVKWGHVFSWTESTGVKIKIKNEISKINFACNYFRVAHLLQF
jgi:hypothetical protein